MTAEHHLRGVTKMVRFGLASESQREAAETADDKPDGQAENAKCPPTGGKEA